MDALEEARNFSKEMSEKYEVPSFPHTEFIVKKGIEFARKLNADEKIVAIGCYLIDIMLGKSLEEGKQEQHVKIGVETAKTFLKKFDLPEKDKEKILNCIAAHHGQVEHSCIESEIVKNSDNFKFLDPTGIVISIFNHPKNRTTKQTIDILKQKVEEKRNLVTLDICKKEAEENYKIIKEFLNKFSQ